LDELYRIATGRPKPKGSLLNEIGRAVEGLMLYRTDPGVAAYYKTRKLVRDYQQKELGKAATKHLPSKASNALYWYKQALRLGDLEAADRYLKRYFELGGSRRGMKRSITMAHPLTGLSNRERRAFYQSLNEDDRETLQNAEKWYVNTYKGGRR
jgi:TPR repeat protein